MELNIFGGTGFVGTGYITKYQSIDKLHIIDRNDRIPVVDKDILYLISTTHNYNIFTDPLKDVDTNLVVLMETLKAWKEHSPNSVFNFVSSWFVYGDGGYEDGFSQIPAREDSIVFNPKGFYSITKLTAERLIQSYAETFDLKYRIFRLSNVIGPGDKGVGTQKNALQYLINEMKDERDIDLYGGGHFFRTYMDVEDCARAMKLVMLDGELNSVYNIGSHSCYFYDLIKYVKQKLEYKGKINKIEPKDFHKKVQTQSFKLNTEKLYSLGYSPKYTIQQTLDRMMK